MARVPTLDTFRVNPSGGGEPTYHPPSSDGFGYAARQTKQMGQAIESSSSDLAQVVAHEQDQANRLRVMEAENAAREAAIHLAYDPQEGYTQAEGGNVMHRDSGKPLAVEYGEKYQAQLDDIASGLSNDAQREAFQASSMQLRTTFDAQATAHEAREYRSYQISLAKGSADLAAQEIALHPSDFDFIDQRLPTLDVAVAEVGRLHGLSGNEVTALQNTARSGAISSAIAAAIDGEDITTASNLFDHYKDNLLAPDKARIEGPLRKEQEGRIVMGIGDLVSGAMPGTGVERPQVEKVFNSLIQQESHWQAGAIGPMTQWGQAKGMGQVLDSTGAGVAKKLGIDWRPELMTGKSEEAKAYQLKISRGYFDECMQVEKGDFNRALMRYHGGPNEDLWGPKTHTYAREVLARAGAKSPTGSIPVTLEDALSVGRAALLAQKPDASPELIRATEAEVSTRWKIRKDAIDQRSEENTASAMSLLMQNGGNYFALPAKVRASIPADKQGALMNFAEGIRSYSDQTDEGVYAELSTNPEKLKSMSNSEWMSYTNKLSRDDFKRFSALRGELIAGRKDGSVGSLNSDAINRSFNSRWASLGLDTTPKSDDVEALQHLGAARRYVDQAVAAEQQHLGRQMNDIEVQKFIDSLFLKQSVTPGGWFSKETYKPRFNTSYEDIAPKRRKEIEDTLAKRGIPVTPDNVMTVFYAM